jgi:hypothetical protein
MRLFVKRHGRDAEQPADPAFTRAIAVLQWGMRYNRRIGQSGRYDRRAFQALMQVVLRLPPPDHNPPE